MGLKYTELHRARRGVIPDPIKREESARTYKVGYSFYRDWSRLYVLGWGLEWVLDDLQGKAGF